MGVDSRELGKIAMIFSTLRGVAQLLRGFCGSERLNA
ncbi:hypothetical protein MC7420_366 [Coleofasciculus chthonoplastes PCC 7420]|uniref:Uncharacterized protein n=1 Tax=Coleofasciculus chthonoplastes PCC 7420 TaxID=118168 RepID=B4VKS1_9CYAN|nr:hypothetical protein MC7420_366 [Coleofasciculus chthonoplastes PCC 7420]